MKSALTQVTRVTSQELPYYYYHVLLYYHAFPMGIII